MSYTLIDRNFIDSGHVCQTLASFVFWKQNSGFLIGSQQYMLAFFLESKPFGLAAIFLFVECASNVLFGVVLRSY